MFKVLLVDDEVFVRKGLRKLIRWEQLKFSLVGEAKHGGEALEMINRLEPDLVITDIMMPVLDGLGLIRSVKEAGQLDPEYIIISGYHDFKYAQQAIRYGVQDYILKPIDVKELEAALQKLAVTIRDKHLAALMKGECAAAAVLERLIQEELQEEDAAQYARVLSMEGQSGFMYALVELPAAGQPQMGVRALQKLISPCFEIEEPVLVQEQMPCIFGILLSQSHLDHWGENVEEALETFRAKLSALQQHEVTLYAGDIVDRIAQVRQSYLGANQAFKHKYAEEPGTVIRYGQVKDKPLYISEMDPGIYHPLLVALEENDKATFENMINRIFQTFRDQRFTPSAVIGSLSHFSSRVMGVIREMGGSVDRPLRLLEMMEKESCSWELQRLKTHFAAMVTEAAEYIAELRKDQSRGDIERIKRYIDLHFHENMNLKSIAAQFFMSSVYLGQLFRKTYGVYFNEYLLELRVEEAKRLLRQTDLRIYEIAAQVGIPNANYFVIQFEKREKCSPMAYRNRLVKKEQTGGV